jgi:hypothetical protein
MPLGTLGAVTGITIARSGWTLMARIYGANGQLLTQASLASINWSAYDQTAGILLATGFFTPAAAVFNSLVQNDPRWVKDSPSNPVQDWPGGPYVSGYNFLGVVPAITFATPGQLPYDIDPLTNAINSHVVQVDVKFTPVIGEPFQQPYISTPNPAFCP